MMKPKNLLDTVFIINDILKALDDGEKHGLEEIKERTGWSIAYIEQWGRDLKKMGLITSRLGSFGGYVKRLERSEIPVRKIIKYYSGSVKDEWRSGLDVIINYDATLKDLDKHAQDTL